MKNVFKRGFGFVVILLVFAACSGEVQGSGNAISDSFVWVPAETITIDSSADDSEEAQQAPKNPIPGFYMGKYPVTQGQYKAVMRNNPSYFKRVLGKSSAALPVENISWYSAIVFCNKLSIAEGLTPAYRIDGKTDPNEWGSVPKKNNAKWDAVEIAGNSTGYRLPTEAQWEYACRAGTTTMYNWGTDTINDTQANYDASGVDESSLPDTDANNNAGANDDASGVDENSSLDTDAINDAEVNDGVLEANGKSQVAGLFRKTTLAVGSFAPNAWGLYDMHGNVWEWCWDGLAGVNQADQSSGSSRVLRGGAWYSTGQYLTSAYRVGYRPSDRNRGIGFRIVRP